MIVEHLSFTVEEASSCTEADETQYNYSANLAKGKNSVRNKKHTSRHHLVKFNEKEDEEKVGTNSGYLLF